MVCNHISGEMDAEIQKCAFRISVKNDYFLYEVILCLDVD